MDTRPDWSWFTKVAGSNDIKDGIGTDFMINPVEDLNIQGRTAGGDIRTAKHFSILKSTKFEYGCSQGTGV